ncbi:branched-chain amino acid ABC transporter permease [Amycolatopsis pithecellobii]|uniref:Branched-chain amino acid ABC transporter permease n=1 Tax=Amycolatopsis pithecellobii TaxID=664692 RepID=A0A6N7Z6Y1_9PSEU|nr:branched-chain amino acid ABC transporter permease [Amycolatopsis pithecellobii]MTD55446.1 hypothetical protein [Amycolatopsis pithecellobii]
MSQFTVSLLGGIANGAIIALIALGMVLVFRATSTFNFAHGQLMVIPAFFTGLWTSSGRFGMSVSVVLSLLIVGAVGGVFYQFVLRRLAGDAHLNGLIASLGLAAILDGFISLYFGNVNYSFNLAVLPGGTSEIAGARFSNGALTLTVFSLVVTIGVACLLRFTRIGISVRAAGQNALLASQSGINVRRVFLGSWITAAGLAGLAGIVYGSTNVVTPSLSETAFAAFPAIILGGLDSIEGAIIGGVAIGVINGFTAQYWGGDFVPIITYTFLLVVLLVKPAGLFGTAAVTRL